MPEVGLAPCTVAGEAATGEMGAGDGSGAPAKSAKSAFLWFQLNAMLRNCTTQHGMLPASSVGAIGPWADFGPPKRPLNNSAMDEKEGEWGSGYAESVSELPLTIRLTYEQPDAPVQRSLVGR